MGFKNTGWGLPAGLGGDEVVGLTLVAPIHVCTAKAACTRCDELTEVHSLVAMDVVDMGESGQAPSYVYGIKEPSVELLMALAHLAPNLRLAGSNASRVPYLANHCRHCERQIPDGELHESPDGPFNGKPPAGRFGRLLSQDNMALRNANYTV